MSAILRQILADPGLAERDCDPANWPESLRREYGDDNGKASAAAHREAVVHHLRTLRQTLDEFAPDVVLIWGDDQYENFREDVIPPFFIRAYDKAEVTPWEQLERFGLGTNVWGEPADTVFHFPV